LHQEGGRGKRRRRRRAKRVVLVSFLREWLFWRGEGKRLVRFFSISFTFGVERGFG
jgi:hypothetical protein